MSNTLDFDFLRNLSIGTVESVSSSEIKLLLDTDAPHNTAINTGIPNLFPRLNGFVLIPKEDGAIVGIISWIGVEHSRYPSRKGLKDFDLIDLPFPLRKMVLNPVGTLKTKGKTSEKTYELERGVFSFPSIGDSAVLPTKYQVQAIVENKDKNANVCIGNAPIAGNAEVFINPDKLFGRHLAVLGNTGSGKSCSVAGLIRWSIQEAFDSAKKDNINARFIVLDPNGEYINSFKDLNSDLKLYKVEVTEEEASVFSQLKIPAWFWNSYEWGSFSQATAKTQRPVLRQALKELRAGGQSDENNEELFLRKFLSSSRHYFNSLKQNSNSYKIFPGPKNVNVLLKNLAKDLGFIKERTPRFAQDIDALATLFETTAASRFYVKGSFEDFKPFELADIETVIQEIESLLEKVGGALKYDGPNEDSPISFPVEDLPDYLEMLSKDSPHLEFFIMRIRGLLSDKRMASIIADKETTLEGWLNDHMKGIVVIDLSLVPSDIVQLTVAVISRIIFEALQRYRRKTNKVLPTILALEEAHNFIRRNNTNSDDISVNDVCNEIFEKIAREGRKFGLSLIISSQRPSELSATVLSQCNTFLLHRIVNDRDQDLIKRLVPDNIGGLMKELPILPSRIAILLGWASPIPILVEMKELEKDYQPKSNDPDFWDVWTGEEERAVDWSEIVMEWQGIEDDLTAQIDAALGSEPKTSDPE